MGRSGGEIHSLSQEAAVVYRLEALLCSGVSQAVVSTTYDWIFLYTSKANWTYDIILRNSRKSYKLVTYIVNYHFNTDFVHI